MSTQQTSLFDDTPWPSSANPDTDCDALLATYTPTSIWCSVSGGIDSDAAALWARRRWPTRPLVLWHAHLDTMDWPHTSNHLDTLAATLGNARRMTRQAVYERTGALTPTGHAATRLRRSHDVDRDGPATDDDPTAIPTVVSLAMARSGMPPTSSNRWCTSYFKASLCDHDLRAAREQLGARPILISGERRAESPGRSRKPRAEWRVSLQPRRDRPNGHRVLWLRPIIDWQFHHAAQTVLDAGIPFHPGYALQGETLGGMLDSTRPERGRARLSCVTCIFTNHHHLAHAAAEAPALVNPYIQRIQAYERDTGYTWQQRGPLEIL